MSEDTVSASKKDSYLKYQTLGPRILGHLITSLIGTTLGLFLARAFRGSDNRSKALDIGVNRKYAPIWLRFVV